MKKIYLLLMLCVFSCVTWSCSDDDDKDVIRIPVKDLPSRAQSFISDFFGEDEVIKVTKETSPGASSYDVLFASGLEIDFDADGNWTDVDAPRGKVLPAGIVPLEIEEQLPDLSTTTGVNEISRDIYGYELELINGQELAFDTTYKFLGFLD